MRVAIKPRREWTVDLEVGDNGHQRPLLEAEGGEGRVLFVHLSKDGLEELVLLAETGADGDLNGHTANRVRGEVVVVTVTFLMKVMVHGVVVEGGGRGVGRGGGH